MARRFLGPGRWLALLALASPVTLPGVIGARVAAGSAALGRPADSPTGDRPVAAGAAPTMVLVGGTLIDGYGGPVLHDSAVLIRDGRVEAVGPRRAVTWPSETRIIDTRGKTVLPGLIDVHVHSYYLGQSGASALPAPYSERLDERVAPLAARQLLAAGVTTARDPYISLEGVSLKHRIGAGEIPGPRLFVSGPALDGALDADRETPLSVGVGSAAAARSRVANLAAAGVDLIKVLNGDRIAPDAWAALVDEAHRRRLHVASHAYSVDEILRGLAAGVDSFEHLDLGLQPGYPQEVLAAIRRRNASLYWVPTLIGDLAYLAAEEHPQRLDDARASLFVPPDLWAAIRTGLAAPSTFAWTSRVRRFGAAHPGKLRELRDSGVTLLVGSDSGTEFNFHTSSTWREMWSWEQAGIEPMAVIQAATYWPARLLRRDDIGVIRAGGQADVIVIAGLPLESLRDLRYVDAVIRGGRVYVEDGRWVGP